MLTLRPIVFTVNIRVDYTSKLYHHTAKQSDSYLLGARQRPTYLYNAADTALVRTEWELRDAQETCIA